MRPICSRLLLLLYICAILVFESVATTQFQPCDGVPSVPQTRRACNLFIWDAPSALLYKWCHHLLKDHLIEGKGGRMVGFLSVGYSDLTYHPSTCPEAFKTYTIFVLCRFYPFSMFALNPIPSCNCCIPVPDTVPIDVLYVVGVTQTI